jgi:hypothetical protein
MNQISIKLTKKVFMAAPAGWVIASNCLVSPSQSVFEERVASSIPGREAQWQRIVAAGASQRLCRVFQSHSEYQTWLSTIVLPTDAPRPD